ncbi:uridine kinase [Streptomyces sp. NPDC056465]|uniref:uridine kinase family protein n=1 Tax=Streptomyces sp. NPDC056465 TaxID=3345829 RepID=UPI0036CDB87B
MPLSAPPVPVLALGGGAGSGKTTLAEQVAKALPGAQVVHLDGCFHTAHDRAPVVPAIKGCGFVIDYSNPLALDWDRVQQSVDRAVYPDTRLLVVEGTFALLPPLRSVARWTAYVDTPADLRLARKTLRKISDGADPEISLRGYLAYGRDSFDRHVAPIQSTADLALDGTRTIAEQVQQVLETVSPALGAAVQV